MTQSLLIAAAGLLSVGALSLTLGLLLATNGRRKALSFAAGYFLNYLFLGVLFSTFFDPELIGGVEGESSPWIFVIFGGIFLFLGLKNLLSKPKSDQPSGVSRLFKSIDALTWKRTLLIGLGVPLINFKSLIIYVSALAVLPQDEATGLGIASRILLLTTVFCLPVILPNLVVWLLPKQATAVLTTTKRFLERHSRPITTYVPLLLGTLFLVNAFTR